MRISFLLCLALPAQIMAAPFIISDPPSDPLYDKCVYQIGTAAPVETPTAIHPPQTLAACKVDTGGFAAGTYSMQFWWRSSLWGVGRDSLKAPFVLVVPAVGGPAPSGLRLAP